MFDNSQNSSLREKALNYLEFLSLYEKELYLESARAVEKVEAPRADERSTKRPAQSSLNPYPAYAPYDSLHQMEAAVGGCLKCTLGSSRNKLVFGTGSSNARVVFIGEAPGAEEDRLGEPFVGRAGKLLRDPLPDEISMCEPYLHEQLRLLDPDWLVALGRVSAQVLLRTTAPLRTLRGRVHKYRGKPFWVTYHPAALLRNQNLMPDAHQDLLNLKQMVIAGPDIVRMDGFAKGNGI